jgi:hypothetical protein
MFTTFRCQCDFNLAKILLPMGLPLSAWSVFVLSMCVALLLSRPATPQVPVALPSTAE